jgi:1-acyl-sn-glycerol-3-phosphate acyltransferase
VGLLPPSPDRASRWAHQVAASLSRLEVLDPGRLRQPGPVIYAVQHTALVDVAVVLGALHRVGVVAAATCRQPCRHHAHTRVLAIAQLWDYPLMRQLVSDAGVIPVQRDDLRGIAAFRSARAALAAGESVLLYPEGDVSAVPSGRPRQLRTGAVRLARQSGVPVVPIAHHDVRAIGHRLLRVSLAKAAAALATRPRITLAVGEPIPAAALSDGSTLQANRVLREALTDQWRRAATRARQGPGELACRSGDTPE